MVVPTLGLHTRLAGYHRMAARQSSSFRSSSGPARSSGRSGSSSGQGAGALAFLALEADGCMATVDTSSSDLRTSPSVMDGVVSPPHFTGGNFTGSDGFELAAPPPRGQPGTTF